MDKLQWFKFSPYDWNMGKVKRVPELTQYRFIMLMMLYWNKECILSLEDAELEIDKEHLDILLSKKVVKSFNGRVIIDFMDEQLNEAGKTSIERKKAANIRWDKHRENLQENANALQNSNSAMQSYAEERREEEKREEKKDVKRFTPPTISDVEEYFKEKGYTELSAKKAFEYYNVANWKDSKGNQVKNWKQKMQGVWFKPENEIKTLQTYKATFNTPVA